MKLSDYWTLQSAASELGVAYKTLYMRVHRGHIKTEFLGKIHLIHTDELERVKREIRIRPRKRIVKHIPALREGSL